jgi:methylenetetrahydrofolate dehydrogenase (NADP+)/methenyltetrahydrofolate cyclohydrolase
MSAEIIDGKKVAELVRDRIREDVQDWKAKGNRTPFLQVILVGDDPASKVYTGAKTRACEDVGIETHTNVLQDTISAKELKSIIRKYNQDDGVDGILVQLPLPAHLSAYDVIECIDYRKDVDGFHPVNYGRMASNLPAYVPATPFGVMELLKRYDIITKGKHCVVVGRSHIVGSPVSILMGSANYPGDATVTLTHRHTVDLAKHTKQADILIVAVGKPGLITGDMVKNDVVVIDVGTTRVPDASKKSGFALKGDVVFDDVAKKATHITPVPGGVGPMTRAGLLMNTWLAAQKEIYGKELV